MRLALDACRRTQAHPKGHRRNRRHRSRARGPLILKINRRQEMDLGLRGKAAVVSGSTAGIGLAIATALAAEGAKVVVNGRTEARIDAALDKIRQRVANAELRGVAADLGTANGVDAFLNQVTEADVLVNNLGIFEVKPF